MTYEILQDTGIGKAIRSLTKHEGKIGAKSTAILSVWRKVVYDAQCKETETKTSPSNHHKDSSKTNEIHRKHDTKSIKENEVVVLHQKRNEESSQFEKSFTNHRNEIFSGVKDGDGDSEYSSKSTLKLKSNVSKKRDESQLPNKHYQNTSFSQLNNLSQHIATKKRSSSENERGHEHKSKRLKESEASVSHLVTKDVLPCLASSMHKNLNKQYQAAAINDSHSQDKSPPKHKSKKHKTHSKDSTELLTSDGELQPQSSEKHISKKKKSSRKTQKSIPQTDVFTPTEVSFEDCLNMSDVMLPKKKKVSKVSKDGKEKKNKTSLTKKNKAEIKSVEEKNSFPPPPTQPLQLKFSPKDDYKDDTSPFSSLPQPLTNYRPLPHRTFDEQTSPKKALTNEDAIKFTSSKREKTCVYSGKKHQDITEVPKLIDACLRVLMDHIDEIGYFGYIPYFVLSPLYKKCSPRQLFNLEHYNPLILEDTQELWEIHCKRDFRSQKPFENETWRDLYWRAYEERERKLKSLTASISKQMNHTQKSNRYVKLAYVDAVVKPPRDVARRQAKNGTAAPVNHSAVKAVSTKQVDKPLHKPSKPLAVTSVKLDCFKPQKPKVAPLMAKTLKSMKQCFRR